GGPLRAQTSGGRQARRRDPLRRQRRSEAARPVRVICERGAAVMAPHTDLQTRAFAEFRFYEELNDFLAPELRKRAFRMPIDHARSVKDAIESVGVPHTEVDLVLVDGASVAFEHVLRGGERVAVYPVFE